MAKHGYHSVTRTASLRNHTKHDIVFILGVKHIGVKYVGKENYNHLFQSPQSPHTIAYNWEDKTYLGVSLQWDYRKCTVDLLIPDYIPITFQ